MMIRAILLVLVTVATAMAQSTASQNEAADARFLFYHASTELSGFVETADAGQYRLIADQTRRLALPAGSLVCITAINGHSVNYAYGIDAAVDTSAATLPDLSKQAKLLGGIIKPAADQAPNAQPAAAPPAWTAAVDSLNRLIRVTLEADVDSADAYVELSETPEDIASMGHPTTAGVGFQYAREAIKKLAAKPGHFNDARAKDTLAARFAEARKTAKGNDVAVLTINALAAYADALRSHLNQILSTFNRATPAPTACGRVGRGRTTLTLTIARKDTTKQSQRAFGKNIARVVNEAAYERPLVSLAPVAFALAAPGTPEFVISNGVLRDAGTRAHFRVGAIIAFNRYSGGPFNLFGTSFGLGLGTQGNTAPLSDVFATVMLSVGDVIGVKSDIIRIGLGAGASYLPDRVKEYETNSPYPTTAGKLEDRFERAWRPALYLTFLVPTLDIGASP